MRPRFNRFADYTIIAQFAGNCYTCFIRAPRGIVLVKSN